MRSLLRDVVEQVHAARNDLFFAWLAFAAFTIGGCTAAQATSRTMAKARAALALAKAKREARIEELFRGLRRRGRRGAAIRQAPGPLGWHEMFRSSRTSRATWPMRFIVTFPATR